MENAVQLCKRRRRLTPTVCSEVGRVEAISSASSGHRYSGSQSGEWGEQCHRVTSLLASGERKAFQNTKRSVWRKRRGTGIDRIILRIQGPDCEDTSEWPKATLGKGQMRGQTPRLPHWPASAHLAYRIALPNPSFWRPCFQNHRLPGCVWANYKQWQFSQLCHQSHVPPGESAWQEGVIFPAAERQLLRKCKAFLHGHNQGWSSDEGRLYARCEEIDPQKCFFIFLFPSFLNTLKTPLLRDVSERI